MANSKKDKIYFSMLAVGVVLIVVAFANKSNKSPDNDITGNANFQEQNSLTDNPTANVTEGVLFASDDLSRGNLRLVSRVGDIYIRTARDFSSLIGLEVVIKTNGTLDKFELLDIQPKLAKDGYIHQ